MPVGMGYRVVMSDLRVDERDGTGDVAQLWSQVSVILPERTKRGSDPVRIRGVVDDVARRSRAEERAGRG
jgi:hypothetical protein